MDSSDNTKVYHLNTTTNTLTQLDVDPSDSSGDNKSRDHLIQALWHDRDNQIIWGVDCDNDGTADDFDVWKLDYSASETAPTVTEVGTSTGQDVNTVYAYDVFMIGANVYVSNMEERAGSLYWVMWDVDTAPFTEKDKLLLVLPAGFNFSFGLVIGTIYYVYFDNKNVNKIYMLYYDDSVPVLDNLDDITGYSFASTRNIVGMAYDGSNIIYLIINKDADSKNYLISYSISGDSLTVLSEYNISLMLDRNTDSSATPEVLALEKAFHLTEMRVYQLPRTYTGSLNFIANWLTSRPSNNTIVAITDSYLIIDNNGTIELWEFIDILTTLIVECIINTEERMRPSSNLLWLKKTNYSDPPTKDQLIQIFGRYSSANLGECYYMNAPHNFNLETTGAITAAGDMDWITTITLPNTCSAALGTINNHKNVLSITHDGGADDPIVTHEFDAQLTSGTYEWWWGSSDVVHNQTLRFRGTGIAVYLRINTSKYTYLDSIDAEIEIVGAVPTNNILDHFSLVFDCATDTFDLYINGTLRVNDGEFNNVDTYIDELYMAIISNDVATLYIDAPSDVAHTSYYTGKNEVKYLDDQVIFEGRVKDYNLNIAREIFAISQAIELERIFPNITSYTNYTGKTTGPIITQLLADYANYITSGSISAGSITWTCPDDWEAQGDKNLLTIINELCDSEYFSWRLRPTGELDVDDGSLSTNIKFQSIDDYINPLVTVLSQDINQVIVWGGLVGAIPVGPYTADDEANQQLVGGIITWSKRYAGVFDPTALQTIADNKLLLQGASPLLYNVIREMGGTTEFGFVQCGETWYIDSNVRVEEDSDEYVTVGHYILNLNDFNVREDESNLQLTEGILWQDNPFDTLAQENHQQILQLAETITAGFTRDVWVPAQGLRAPGLKPATFISHGIAGVWEFSDEVEANEETISGSIKFPTGMDLTAAPSFSIGWSSTTLSSDCYWQLEYLYTGAGEDTTGASQDTQLSAETSSGVAEGLVVSTFTLEVPTSTDVCVHFRIKRKSGNALDTINGDTVDLHGVCLSYTSGAGGGGVGEVNTGSNVGTDGVGVYDAKVGVDLQFRHIAPASAKITVVENGNDIDLDVAEGEISHDSIADVSADDHHNESHTVASHSDTTGTGAELETLTDGSDAAALHKHNKLYNDLDLDVYEIKIDSDPADHVASGIKAVYTAGENLVFGNLVYMKPGDSKMWKAKADAEATCHICAMALATIAAEATGEFLLYGIVEDADFNFSIGLPVYLDEDTAGLGNETKPVAAGEFVVCIGVCMDHADRLMFNPQYEYIKLA